MVPVSLEDILKRERCKWMEGSGPSADIVLSSRVRLARNLRDVPFAPRMTSHDAERVVAQLEKAVPKLQEALGRKFALYPLAGLDALDRQVLVEKHLISPLLARNDAAAVILSDDEAVSVMIHEEDHLRIQCLMPGMQLAEAWKLADAVDDVIAHFVDYAFEERRGYLTTCPTNLGTGMRVSVMMHLPGLVAAGQAGRILGTLSKVGIVVRGIYGEGSEAKGNLFQVSNQVTLGQTETEILDNLDSVARQLVHRERSAREMLYNKGKEQLEDRVCRAYGILTNARIMTSDEALRLLSDVRLGIDMNMLPRTSPHVFNDLIIATRRGFLQKLAGQELSPAERDKRRATLIRRRMEEATRQRGDRF